ncbi:hypothetical protein [Rhodoferax saidenbachensis]|uniref:hypothetical protein n=1 Tax=Rhodoferax saidenbachensis TaxID=1484693 RepID=UPI0038F5F99F
MKSKEIPAERFAEVREWFAVSGTSCSEWAAQHRVDRGTLYAVLSGKSRCLRGETHRIAVLLGLKPKTTIEEKIQDKAPDFSLPAVCKSNGPSALTWVQPTFNWSWAMSVSNYRSS